MRGSTGRAILVASVIAGSLAAAPAAFADDRYASPTGTGPAATCPATDPCDIQTAVEDSAVDPGDRIVVLPGTYPLVDSIDTTAPVVIEGAEGQPRPRLESTGMPAVIVDTASVLRNLHIETENNNTGRALDMIVASLAERLEVVATGTTGTAVQLRDGAVLRDSVAWNSEAANGIGVATGGTGGDLRNVTAIAPLSGGVGVLSDAAFGDTQSVSLRNVIARGPADGRGIQAADNAGTDSVTVTVSSSNYSSLDDDEPQADIVEGGTANQTASPAFANAATGNFHQLSNSLTIDAGSVDPLLGELDIDGEARSQGAAPDIGADELTVTPIQTGATDNFPPETGIRKGPKKKTFKRNAKIEFGGSEPGVTFECQLDDNAFEPCTSPDKLRGLTRGKHVFAVRAVDAAGNRDPTPADRRWKITKKRRK